MKLKHATTFFSSTHAETRLLISELERSLNWWYVISCFCSVPLFLTNSAIFIMSATTVNNCTKPIGITITVLSALATFLIALMKLLNPEGNIEASKQTIENLEAQARQIDTMSDILMGDAGVQGVRKNDELPLDMYEHYRLSVMQLKLDYAILMKGMPSKFFIRTHKTQLQKNKAGISADVLDSLRLNRPSAYDVHTSEETVEVPTFKEKLTRDVSSHDNGPLNV